MVIRLPWAFKQALSPHPEERPLGRVSKDEVDDRSWFETRAKGALLAMRL
jgi:hypothetical protein